MGSLKGSPDSGGGATGSTILVVEDNPLTMKMVETVLADAGFRVSTAEDGAAALRALQRDRPVLVLLDMQLPDVDGSELLDRLRQQPEGARIPILAFSGHITRLEEARAANAAFTDFVPKPVKPSVLISIVRSHLSEATRIVVRSRRVLLVDDDPVQLKAIRMHLLGGSFDVLAASSAADALRQARIHFPDVILCDVSMPEMDGFQLCEAVRADPALRRIPVVLTSAHHVDEQDQQMGLAAGASAYLCRSGGAAAIVAALRTRLAVPQANAAPAAPTWTAAQRRSRIEHQLERQMHIQTLTAQRQRTQNSILQHFAVISDSFPWEGGIDLALGELLATCLGDASLSKGLLYTLDKAGDLVLKAQIGLPGVEEEAGRLFRDPALFQSVMEHHAPVAFPSERGPAGAGRAILARLEANSMLIVPLASHDQSLGLVVLASASGDLGEDDWLVFGQSLALQLGQAVLLADTIGAMAESERRLRSVFDCVEDAIFTIDDQALIQDANPALARLTGRSPESARGTPMSELAPKPGRPAAIELFRLLQQDGTVNGELPFLRPDGLEGLARFSGSRITPQRYVAVMHDVTLERRQAETVRRLAYYDPLTELPNRTALHEHLASSLAECRTRAEGLALLVFNIARFRQVNETLGHHNGDLLLVQIATKLRLTIAGRGFLARLGGDQFAVVVPMASGATAIADFVTSLRQALRAGFVVAGVPLDLAANIGSACFPEHAVDAVDLLRFAEAALFRAKRSNQYWMSYDPKLDHHDPNRLALMAELRNGIPRGELVLHYQPKLDLASMRLVGAEALVRWQHPARGLLYPDSFIPDAERTGLIHPMTKWVLAAAMDQAARWAERGVRIDVSANISVNDLQEPDFAAQVGEMLRRHTLSPERLILEVTESAIMHDAENGRAVLQQLCGLGVKLALDDFGVGQSSLTYLKDLPLHSMKIDKSFVIGIKDPRNGAIVRAAVSLGAQLGLAVTAEGVEDEDTLQALCAMGCTTAQGYHISKPLALERFETWMRESRWSQGAAPCGA